MTKSNVKPFFIVLLFMTRFVGYTNYQNFCFQLLFAATSQKEQSSRHSGKIVELNNVINHGDLAVGEEMQPLALELLRRAKSM